MPWTYVIENLNGEKLLEIHEKELQKIYQTEFGSKSNQKKVNKLYVKWKSYDNYFICGIDSKNIVIENELFS